MSKIKMLTQHPSYTILSKEEKLLLCNYISGSLYNLNLNKVIDVLRKMNNEYEITKIKCKAFFLKLNVDVDPSFVYKNISRYDLSNILSVVDITYDDIINFKKYKRTKILKLIQEHNNRKIMFLISEIKKEKYRYSELIKMIEKQKKFFGVLFDFSSFPDCAKLAMIEEVFNKEIYCLIDFVKILLKDFHKNELQELFSNLLFVGKNKVFNYNVFIYIRDLFDIEYFRYLFCLSLFTCNFAIYKEIKQRISHTSVLHIKKSMYLFSDILKDEETVQMILENI